MLFPVLDLALPAGKWASEDAVLCPGRGGGWRGSGTQVLGRPHLQQYHSFWHREQRLEASVLQ